MAAIVWVDKTGEVREYQIEGDEFSIGRESSCDLCLTTGSVSRLHATIRREGEKYLLCDSSTNGTLVDNVLVQNGESQEIGDNSSIVVGDTKLTFSKGAGEFDEGRTMLVPEKKPPRIILFDGGKPSKEFPFDEDEISIGTEASNDIVLAGDFVSRFHARIIRDGDTFTIKDSSANGTFVNSKKITEQELEDGDSIKIVDHELQFAISEAPARIAPSKGGAPDKKKKMRIIILAAACGVLLVLIGVLATMPTSKKRRTAADEVSSPTMDTSFNSVLEEADALIGQERWGDALKKLESVETTNPAYLAAQKRMRVVRSEMRCVEAKPEIIRLIAEESFVEAGDMLRGIPPDSNCAEALRLEFEARLGQFCENNLKLARENLELDKPAEAKLFVEKCLAAMPQHQEALQLAQLLKEKMGEVSEPETAATTAAVTAAEEKNREVARAKYDQAISAYLRGEFSSAISDMRKIASLKLPPGDATKSKAAKATQTLKDAQSRYTAGKSQYEGGNTSTAYGEWNDFLKYDRLLDPRRKGVLYRNVAEKMTATYCQYASSKYEKGDYAEAFDWWRRAKEIDPANAAAKKGIDALEKRAIKKYREGYMLASQGNVQGAVKDFKEVLQILPKNHEYYVKAQKKLVEIGQ
jgi:pSer/pThr/pTyr-binding forkhead associated (FHA) protein/tetratricopeptide (TPR) repeat protein